MGQEAGWERWAPCEGPGARGRASSLQIPGTWGHSAQHPGSALSGDAAHRPAAGRGQDQRPHAASAPNLSFPRPRGHRPAPLTSFFQRGKVQNKPGAESRPGRRPRATGAVRVALFTREAEEARPAGKMATGRARPAGRGCGGPGASSSRRAAGPRGLGSGPGWGARSGAGGGRKAPRPGQRRGTPRERAGGGTCCSGPCAPGRPPLFSSWRSRRRRAAPTRSRARPLRTDGAVSGPPASAPPARPRSGRTKGRRALPRSLRSRYSAASSRISREFSSILPPARPRRERFGTAAAAARPAPLAARPARPAAPLPQTPADSPSARLPPLRLAALKLTHKGERRPAQQMGAGARAAGAGPGSSRGQWEPAARLRRGREC